MSAADAVSQLLAALVGSRTADDAVTLLHSALAQVVEREGHETPDIVTHVRPGGSYRTLYSASRPSGRAFAPSASAWRRLECGASWTCVDCVLGLWWTDGEEEAPAGGALGPSIVRHLTHGASHVLALPLACGGLEPVGMVTLELSARGLAGRLPLSETAIDTLVVLGRATGAVILGLPLTASPVAMTRTDPLLPVMGRALCAQLPMLEVFASQPDTVLVQGPTGSGKTRLARWIHAHSTVAAGAFEVLDLNTVPPDMQPAELFGWRRGAFTGAERDHRGAVERAEGGTLFLDEIDKLSLKAQAALLTLLEDGSWRPLGADGPMRRARIRFLAGTNANLRAEVAAGRFREDLYYRVCVLPVQLLPLGERRDEIVGWARHMVAELPDAPTLTHEAEDALERASWPGNLRQLQNLLRRASALARTRGERRIGRIDIERGQALDPPAAVPGSPADAFRSFAMRFVSEIERRRLTFADLEALPGAVMEEAFARAGDAGTAFRNLGLDTLVEQRNHSRTLQRERARWNALLDKLGG